MGKRFHSGDQNTMMCLSFLALVACVTLGLSASPLDDCPHGALPDPYLAGRIGGSCFRFELRHALSYEDAQTDCKNGGGFLAVAKTKDINDFLYERLTRVYRFTGGKVFIGLNDDKDEGKYRWEDGTHLGDAGSTYTNWAPGSGPNRSWAGRKLKDCVTIDTNEHGKWVDTHCYEGYTMGKDRYYICEYRIPKEKLHLKKKGRRDD